MKHVNVRCHGKIVSRVLHKTENNKKYTIERKPGGGLKRKYR
jgi:hypothetical protein